MLCRPLPHVATRRPAPAPLAGSRALQHRGGRLRQASARQARDGLGGLAGQRAPGQLGRASGSRGASSPTSCASEGVERGDRVAMLLPATPETAAAFFGTWKTGAILLSMSVLYGDEGIRHRVEDSQAKVADHERGERRPDRPRPRRGGTDPRRQAARRRLDPVRDGRHRGRRPGAALLLLGHDRAGEGHPSRAPLYARPRGVHLLPRRAGRRALPRHGRVGLGGRDRAAARPVAARRDAVRLPAPGRVRSRAAARGALEARRDERLHDADGDALDDGSRRRRQALSAAVPDRLLGGRAAQPGGDPLVPRAVRADGARLLRADRVVSAVRELPVHGGA